MAGALEAEIEEVIRRLRVAEDRERSLARRTTALAQGMRELWMFGGGRGGFTLSNITGSVIGCRSAPTPMANSSLRLVGHQTGTDYGTFAVATGTYNISYFRDPADFNLDAYVSHPSARFAGGPPYSINTSGAIFGLGLTPAPGYACLTQLCNFPLANTLSVQDSRMGTGAITFGAGGGFGAGDWTSGSGDPFWILQNAGIGTFGTWHLLSSSGNASYNVSHAPTCPDGASVKFDQTHTWAGNFGPYLIGDTVRIFEP